MTPNNIHPIETLYNGVRFRSRLEARWAVYFDALGIQWRYEFEGYNLPVVGYYLPDFWLPPVNMWAEVKPGKFSAEESQKCRLLATTTGYMCLLLDGPPEVKVFTSFAPESDPDWPPTWEYVIDNQFLDEHRFFSSPDDASFVNDAGVRASQLALNYRFEYGQQGGD
jgi:hypothetical protein